MPRQTDKALGSARNTLYDSITTRIIAQLEDGRLPWAQPWDAPDTSAAIGLPQNAASKRPYSGINILILWDAVMDRGFSTHIWLTFAQALHLGGHVRKGERGTTVVYADRFIPKDERRHAEETGEDPRAVPFLKRFTVFNIEQCDGLPKEIVRAIPTVRKDLIAPNVDRLIKASGIDFRIGGAKAYYNPVHDYVQVPPPQLFFEPVNWHRTALHEMSHATGHHSRLGRDMSGVFGSKAYSFEELVAEISAAYLCATFGVEPTVRHADYIGAWLAVLREDNRAIFRAASLASRAADYLLSFLPSTDEVDQ